MSGRPGITQKRFSRDRFQQLPSDGNGMATPRDAAIDIPLTAVTSKSQTGSRQAGNVTGNPTALPGSEGGAAEKPSNSPPAGRRMATTTNMDSDSDSAQQLHSHADGALNKMGKLYLKILNFSVVTRYFIYVLPLALLIAIPIIIGATAARHAAIGGVRIVWFFTWIEVLWLSLWVSKAIAHYIPSVFQLLCGIVSSGTRKYALILTALEMPISLVGWSATSLATFIPLMTRNPDKRASGDTGVKHWEDVVKNVLFAALVSTLILAAEKVLVQLIAIGHHREQFDMKIQESKQNIRLLTLLYETSRKMFPEYCKEFEAEDYLISDSIMGGANTAQKRTGLASPMRLMQNVGRVGDKISAAVGNVAQEITGKQAFNSTSAHSVVIMALEKQKASEALARRLWVSFVLHGRDALYLEDLKDVFGPGREKDAEDGFAVLDRDENGDISLEEMILTVADFGTTRHSISKSMHDTGQAIRVLDNLLCFAVFVAAILILVAFLNKGFGTTLAAAATAMLSLSFMFSVSAQEVLASCIFLFVEHPYDVGDRVDIGNRILVVERISLLYTTFRSVSDQRTTQFANAPLHIQWIDNITRSKAMHERITLTVDFGTSFGDIQLLKKEIQSFVLDKENSRDFQPDVDIEVLGLGEMSKLELCIEIRHKSNWANESVRATRRSKFMCALVAAIRKVPIYGPGGGDAALGAPGNPSYSVTISDEGAQTKRDEFEADKEKGHMVPTSEMDSVLTPTTTPPQPPAAEFKATGVEAHDKSNSEVQYRGAAADKYKPPGVSPSEATLIGSLHSRPAETPQQESRDGSSSSDAPRPVLREPSTGRRPPAAPNPALVSPNTPIDPSETPPSFPTRQPPTTTTGSTPTTEYYEDTAPQFAPGAGPQSRYQPPPTPPPAASVRPGPESPQPPPPRRPPISNAFAYQRDQRDQQQQQQQQQQQHQHQQPPGPTQPPPR